MVVLSTAVFHHLVLNGSLAPLIQREHKAAHTSLASKSLKRTSCVRSDVSVAPCSSQAWNAQSVALRQREGVKNTAVGCYLSYVW